MSHSVPRARNSKPYYGLFPKQAPKPYYGLFWGGGHHLWQPIGSDSEGKLFLWGYPKTAPPPKRRSSLLLAGARSAPKILRITL